jgi:hypothetical protein
MQISNGIDELVEYILLVDGLEERVVESHAEISFHEFRLNVELLRARRWMNPNNFYDIGMVKSL